MKCGADDVTLLAHKEAVMRRLDTSGTADDYLSETEARQLEEGLRILAKIMAKAMLRKRSVTARSRYE